MSLKKRLGWILDSGLSDFSGFPFVNVRLTGDYKWPVWCECTVDWCVFGLGRTGDVFGVHFCPSPTTDDLEHPPNWPWVETVAVVRNWMDRWMDSLPIKGNRSNMWRRSTSVTPPPSTLRASPLALAFILDDLTCGKLHQCTFSLINSARRERVYFWFCSTNRKLTTVEAHTSVAAHRLISMQAALLNGKKNKKTLSHLTLSVFPSKHLLCPFVGLTAVHFQVFSCQQ